MAIFHVQKIKISGQFSPSIYSSSQLPKHFIVQCKMSTHTHTLIYHIHTCTCNGIYIKHIQTYTHMETHADTNTSIQNIIKNSLLVITTKMIHSNINILSHTLFHSSPPTSLFVDAYKITENPNTCLYPQSPYCFPAPFSLILGDIFTDSDLN